jgi:hypothetical protein
MVDLTPYSTVRPLFGPLQSWLGPDDAARLESYTVYEAIYRNVPEAFRLVRRGSEQNPLYVPSAKTIVEATNRYLAKRWTYALEPQTGTTADRLALDTALKKLFRREMVWSKFATQKRYGLVRGDQVWHVVADPNKEQGSRISIYEVDPAAYFPITDPWNDEKLYGVHLVDPVVNEAGKTVIKRQTYRKEDNGRISYELSWWQVGAWDDREDGAELKKATGGDIPAGDANKPVAYELDARITAIPVYHIKNDRDGGLFGKSELAGLETIIAGINQSISDEDLALALEGLGLYATTSGPPVDDDGNEENWRLGPGWVVEIDRDSTFERVSGVGSVEPYQTHINSIKGFAHESAGIPDIAVGAVDVQTAESGIALAFKMAPILAKNEEKEQEILSVMDHMLYDLTTMWFPVYEGFTTAARPVSIVDDPMPTNRKATLDEIVAMLSTDPPLISAAYARTLLSEKLGYDFPDEIDSDVVDEAAAIAAARNVDPFASRVAAELEETGQ